MNEGGLVGIWDAIRYGPGSMSDEKLTFLADGRGFWMFSNAGEAYAETFRWSTGKDGTLDVAGTASYLMEFTEEGRVTEGPGHLLVEGIRFHTASEKIPGKNQSDILTLDVGGEQWSKALVEHFGVLSVEFRRRITIRGYKPPGF